MFLKKNIYFHYDDFHYNGYSWRSYQFSNVFYLQINLHTCFNIIQFDPLLHVTIRKLMACINIDIKVSTRYLIYHGTNPVHSRTVFSFYLNMNMILQSFISLNVLPLHGIVLTNHTLVN